jgi:hypothetical protein
MKRNTAVPSVDSMCRSFTGQNCTAVGCHDYLQYCLDRSRAKSSAVLNDIGFHCRI